MATAELFSADDLGEVVDEDVTTEKHTVVERVVWGWVSDALGLADDADRPDPVTNKLWAWSVELGAIAHENLKGLTAYQLGEERLQFGGARRDELLELVAASTPSTPTSAKVGPRYRGPRCSEPYPDPARPRAYAGRLREPER